MIKIQINTWKYINLFKSLNNNCYTRLLSTSRCKYKDGQQSIEVKDNNTKLTEDIRMGNIKISTNLRTKQPKREPLLKNFFLGVVDKDLLAYPESINNEDTVKLEENNQSLKSFIETNVNLKNILKSGLTSFGLNTPQIFKGSEYNLTENLLTNEIESQNTDLSILLNGHRAVTQMIVEHGSDKIKQKYLEKLSTGEIIGTFALFEESLNENGTFNTKASLRSNEKVWTINGTKSFVLNGLNPSLYLIFARTISENEIGNLIEGVSAFLVDADNVNILRSEPNKSFGCLGLSDTTITLNNVEVPKENLLGKLTDGSEIGENLLRYSRIQSSVVALIKMKTIFNEMVKHSMDTNLLGISRMETELIQNRIGTLASQIYAAESIIYFTAGLIDNYDGQDIDIESVVLKIFSLESLLKVSLDGIQTTGVTSLYHLEKFETDFRDSVQILLHGERLDALKQYIALAGLRHSGVSLNESVKKARNPLFYPSFTFGKIFDRINVERPKLTLKLNEYLHPSLEPASQWLEESIVRLQLAVDILLSRYGPQIFEKQVEVERLADATVLTYAMFASISRASRSYCIGLQNSDYDMLTASAFALQARNKVKMLITEIDEGPFLSNDANLQKIGRKVFQNKGYFWEHPTKLNY